MLNVSKEYNSTDVVLHTKEDWLTTSCITNNTVFAPVGLAKHSFSSLQTMSCRLFETGSNVTPS